MTDSIYERLRDFIENRMQMQHVYQPVMIGKLLRDNGQCGADDMARELLKHDQSQIDYYRAVTNSMVGRVLRNRGIVRVEGRGEKRRWILVDAQTLINEQRQSLIDLCRDKLQDYIEERGRRIWAHRGRKSAIPGTVEFEVMKRARHRCELCGIPADEKALQIDHITPKSWGGSDDISNLQALCYTHNAMKRDRDDTDFRAVRASYEERQQGCPFCEGYDDRLIAENHLAIAIRDGYPVTEGHTLVIPKRHIGSYWDLSRAEIWACNELAASVRERVMKQDKTVQGFNMGNNDREVAGQTVNHCHIHLIPRRSDDSEDAVGGVRNVIRGKGNYTKSLC